MVLRAVKELTTVRFMRISLTPIVDVVRDPYLEIIWTIIPVVILAALTAGENAGTTYENSRKSQGLPFTTEDSQAEKDAAANKHRHLISPFSGVHNFTDPEGAERARKAAEAARVLTKK